MAFFENNFFVFVIYDEPNTKSNNDKSNNDNRHNFSDNLYVGI